MIRNTSNGITLYGGAYINRHLSVELGYTSFDSWHIDDGYAAVQGQEIGAAAITVSTLAHYAFFDDTLDFYVKFGVADMAFNVAKSSGFGMVYGLGVAYRFDEVYSMKLAYDIYKFDYDSNSDGAADYHMQLEYAYVAIEMQF